MALGALRSDALSAVEGGFELRVGLPWIRSMPVACIRGLTLQIDGADRAIEVVLEKRRVRPNDLIDEPGWWFIQDRLVLTGTGALGGGPHEVAVYFSLMVPYLQAGPGAPLVLPMHLAGRLAVAEQPCEQPAAPTFGHLTDRQADQPADQPADLPAELPAGWMLGTSSFTWTPDIVSAHRAAREIVVDIAASGVARHIELEPGSAWRSFPEPDTAEVDGLREALQRIGGSVSIMGLSLDDFTADLRPRTHLERLAFLLPQLSAAQRVGASGVRLPIGQAGRSLLEALLPELEARDLTLFEELQGQQSPDSPATATALEQIADLGSPRVRALVDVSLLMPALPVTYLEALAASGLPADLIRRVESEWQDPATGEAVLATFRSGGVPSAIHTLYMNMLIRFGRSDASELQGILPLVGAWHLKFWDLDDEDARISAPLTDLGRLLADARFTGTLTSEWGGHEWLDADATELTRAHLALAGTALARGVRGVRSAQEQASAGCPGR